MSAAPGWSQVWQCRDAAGGRKARCGAMLRAPRVRSGPAAPAAQPGRAGGHGGQIRRDVCREKQRCSCVVGWVCLQLVPRTASVPSSAPAAVQHQHAAHFFPLQEMHALIFLHHSFKKGLLCELNCFLLLFNLNLKFMGRIF